MPNVPTPKRADASRIPLEILTEIFVHCLPADSASHETQQLLSGVCRLWRTLVLATPALWASLDIICDINVPRPPLPVIHTYLQRSRKHPLSFNIYARSHIHSDHSYLLAVLTALTAVRQRWRKVYIDSARMTQDILDLITLGEAPLLESIGCDVVSLPQNFSIPLRALLQGCPRLELFRWCSFASPLLLPLVDTRLTSLTLQTELSVSEFTTLLRLSPRLSSAEFELVHSSDPSPTLRLTHPVLCALTIRGEHFPALLDALTLPALLILDLTSRRGSTPSPTGCDIALTTFLERSNSRLQKLSLFLWPMLLEPMLLHILTLIPELHRLNLIKHPNSTTPLTAALILALYSSPLPGTTLCPRLQELQLSGICCSDGLWGPMLRTRWGAQAHANGVTCLESAVIEFHDRLHDCDIADMEKLCSEGMGGRVVVW